jgi:hypothetical protein
MDPMMMAAGAGAALIARLIGEAIAAGDSDRAERLKQQAVAEYGPEILPQLEQATAQEVGSTELGAMSVDPSGRNAQVSALERLGAFADGGFSPEDAAEQRRVTDAAGGVASRQAAQGEQLAASRGLLRSGLSQALGQQAAQAGAQTASDGAVQLAAQRRARQLQALGMMGPQGGALRGADYGEQADRATAQDSINRFNANMRASALDARNRNAMNAYDANMRRLDSKNRARGDLAGFYAGRGERNSQTAQDIGGGVQGGFDSAAGYLEREQARKKGGR